jgi:hypothetical protein
MSRPPAQVVESRQVGDYEWTVAVTPANWEITRDDQPIYIIKQHWLQDRKTYPRMVFSNQAHADRLADKLNRWFNTTAYRARKT